MSLGCTLIVFTSERLNTLSKRSVDPVAGTSFVVRENVPQAPSDLFNAGGASF